MEVQQRQDGKGGSSKSRADGESINKAWLLQRDINEEVTILLASGDIPIPRPQNKSRYTTLLLPGRLVQSTEQNAVEPNKVTYDVIRAL